MKSTALISLLRRIIPYPVRKWRSNLVSKKDPHKEVLVELQQLKEVLLFENHIILPPPKHLQVRVVGGYAGDFIASGYRIYTAIQNAITSAKGPLLKEFDTICDFGCGCGRIIRAFKVEQPSSHLYGSDIDPEAIEWLKNNCAPVAEFDTNPHVPPMRYASNQFDFIFSISIFTHLPEDMQFSWLEELHRLTKPGGYLLISTHGEKHYSMLDRITLKMFIAKGFYYVKSKYITTEGLPSFYQTTYHSHDYIKKEWTRYFDVLDIKSGHIDGQDAVILRKRK
jgi:2-polyprenyl-3-methyl-5-hydroxy-6-metoxy-1,4-benzoquinol methylase